VKGMLHGGNREAESGTGDFGPHMGESWESPGGVGGCVVHGIELAGRAIWNLDGGPEWKNKSNH